MSDRIFTGQKYIGDASKEIVSCHKCGDPIALRNPAPNVPDLAWFDPYAKGGKYVHRMCLSTKRKKEIMLDITA